MSLGNWKSFWQQYRLLDIKSNEDLLYQVGKTIGGNVISEENFEILVNEVVEQLGLTSADNLLDLCCGNGVLTKAMAPYVNKVIGVDFSEPYIKNANKYCLTENTEYILHDVNDLTRLRDKLQSEGINKVLIYDALAYFDRQELKNLIHTLCSILPGESQIMLASVLDRRKMWAFFNTPARKWNYFFNIKLLGKSKGLGTWWKINTFQRIAHELGLKYRIIPQNPHLHTAHYRMNVMLIK